MFNSKNTIDELAMVSRMVTYHQEQGDTVSLAISKLRSNLPVQYEASINKIENLLSGDQSLSLSPSGQEYSNVFSKLADIICHEGGDISKLFLTTREVLRDAAVYARDFWSGFNALVYYLATVFVMATIIIIVFSVQVLPELEVAFSTFGSDLPQFTELILNSRSILFSLVVVFLVITSLYVICAYHIKGKVAQFMPLSENCRWIPLIKDLNVVYSYFLFIHYAKAMKSAGLSDETSVQHAKKLSKLNNVTSKQITLWWSAILSASKMNFLSSEVEFQCAQISLLFNRRMVTVRESVTLGIQLSLGFLIGTFVIAMYLPIFKMGSIV